MKLFQSVKEIEMSSGLLARVQDKKKKFISLQGCLGKLVSICGKSTPLHINIQGSSQGIDHNTVGYRSIMILPAPITYNFWDVPWDEDGLSVLLCAYEVGAVVYFTESARVIEPAVHFRHPPAVSNIPDHIALELAVAIRDIFDHDEPQEPPGQLYLCNLPRLILSAEELATGNASAIATLKLFSFCSSAMAGVGEATWDYFNTRVKLVETGFRPSDAEMTIISERI